MKITIEINTTDIDLLAKAQLYLDNAGNQYLAAAVEKVYVILAKAALATVK